LDHSSACLTSKPPDPYKYDACPWGKTVDRDWALAGGHQRDVHLLWMRRRVRTSCCGQGVAAAVTRRELLAPAAVEAVPQISAVGGNVARAIASQRLAPRVTDSQGEVMAQVCVALRKQIAAGSLCALDTKRWSARGCQFRGTAAPTAETRILRRVHSSYRDRRKGASPRSHCSTVQLHCAERGIRRSRAHKALPWSVPSS
jgi:hypothetical protein